MPFTSRWVIALSADTWLGIIQRQGAKLNYTPSIQLLRRGGTSVYFLIRSGATFFTDWPGGNRFVALNTDRETRRHDTMPHVWRFAEIQYNVDSILLRFLPLLLLLRSSWRTVAKQVAYTVHSAISIRWWIMTMALICWGRIGLTVEVNSLAVLVAA